MTKQRYFRVGAFYRDENVNSVTVQCRDRKTAEEFIPKIKEMLYPGENSENYEVRISEFKLPINRNRLNHFRITVKRPVSRASYDECEEDDYMNAEAFDALIEAEDEAATKEKFISEYFETYSYSRDLCNYDIYVDEEALENVLEERQRMLRQRLISKYATDTYGDLSLSEFNRMMRRNDNEEQNQMFCKALSEHLKKLRMTEYLEKRLETDKLSHAEFCEFRDALCVAKNSEDFKKINLTAITKYGKELHDK